VLIVTRVQIAPHSHLIKVIYYWFNISYNLNYFITGLQIISCVFSFYLTNLFLLLNLQILNISIHVGTYIIIIIITPGERAPATHWIGGWVGPRAGLGDVEKRKFLTLQGLELRPLGHPGRRQSLYRLCYPDSHIMA
jgi:hypothetical protein